MVWPQVPPDMESEAEATWWLKTLKPYGIKQKHLFDPRDDTEKQKEGMSCIFAKIEGLPNNAYRRHQPWVTVKGSSRTGGEGYAVMPDGAIIRTPKSE